MPTRRFTRSQHYLLPPSSDEWLPRDHPARFIAEVLDSWDAPTWRQVGITDAAPTGAPRYDPAMLLALWVYGFLDGRRSSRAIERECWSDLAYRWLSGNQQPDHNTLHRFYQQHRETMHQVFRQTVRIAMASGLVDWTLQAIDGTKLVANASPDQSLTATQLAAVMAHTERAIAELDAQQGSDGEAGSPAMPPALVDATERRRRIAAAQAMLTTEPASTEPASTEPAARTVAPELVEAMARRARIEAAQAMLAADPKQTKANLTDPEARIIKTRRGRVPAYNAQAVVARLATPAGAPDGRIILAAEVTATVTDQGLLPVMVAALAETTGRVPAVVAADKGYHDAASLTAVAERPLTVVMPEPERTAPTRTTPDCFPLTRFRYHPDTDTFTCPADHVLTFRGLTRREGRAEERRYRAAVADCRSCPLRDHCLRPSERSRVLAVPAGIAALTAHRTWMATEEAQALSHRRGPLIEPVFGAIKEQFGLRRVATRGLANVQGEWQLAASVFNLRSLWRQWRAGRLVIAGGLLTRA